MVIRREYLERVRKKSFWLGTLFFPLLMLGLIFFLVTLTNVEEQRKIALVDSTGMNSGELYAVIVAGDDLDGAGNFRFYARSVGNIDVLRTLQRALRDAVIGLRLERSNLSLEREKLEKLLAPIELESFQVAAGGQTKKKGFWDAYVGTYTFVMLLYIAMLLYGIAVMRGILEEKSNRIMEVLLMAIYAATAGVGRLYIAASPMAATWSGAVDAVSPLKLAYFLIFFVLGYFLYTSLFAAVGAVCNSEQEAQNLQTPVVMCLVIPMAATIFFVGNPDSTAAVVISLIPLFTPMVMFMRISVLTPPLWQIALSIALLLAANYIFFKGVGRIFRIGVLMYGKRPTVPEILRWARG
jgi:ABC-2 type transport system permease protein